MSGYPSRNFRKDFFDLVESGIFRDMTHGHSKTCRRHLVLYMVPSSRKPTDYVLLKLISRLQINSICRTAVRKYKRKMWMRIPLPLEWLFVSSGLIHSLAKRVRRGIKVPKHFADRPPGSKKNIFWNAEYISKTSMIEVVAISLNMHWIRAQSSSTAEI